MTSFGENQPILSLLQTCLCAFSKFRKAPIRFVMSVRLSAWNSATTGRIFMKFDIRVFLEKLSRNFKFHIIRTIITGTLHEDQQTCLIISLSILFRMSNISAKFVEEIKTYIMINKFFLENRIFYEIMWKNTVEWGQATDAPMAHALCMLGNKGCTRTRNT